MSKTKHSGENVTSVTVQMRFILLKMDPEQQRFIPLKMDPEQQKLPFVTIPVRVDDTQKGTPDNIQELKLPKIQELALEGETLIQNKANGSIQSSPQRDGPTQIAS